MLCSSAMVTQSSSPPQSGTYFSPKLNMYYDPSTYYFFDVKESRYMFWDAAESVSAGSPLSRTISFSARTRHSRALSHARQKLCPVPVQATTAEATANPAAGKPAGEAASKPTASKPQASKKKTKKSASKVRSALCRSVGARG